MNIPNPSILDSLEIRSRDIVNLARQYDTDSQVTLSAKRRFFLVELDVAGLSPDTITPAQIAAIQAQGYPHLTTLLQAFHRINEYATSPERQQWNPDAQPGRTNVPISFDWFIASIVPEEFNQLDFLSRCERIWADSEPTGEGMLFTRIFNYRVTFVTGYEDGLRLVLCRVEVGERSHPPQVSQPVTRLPQFTVKPFDLTRRMDAYKGDPDGDDWNQTISVPMGIPRWDFTLAEIDRQDFQQLSDLLGAANFQTIVGTQGYSHPQNPGDSYRGDDNLPIHYYLRNTDQANVQELILVGFGEYQPSRWFAHIEGIWQVIEETDAPPEPAPPVPAPLTTAPPEPVAQASVPAVQPPIMPAISSEPHQKTAMRLTAQQRTGLQFLAIVVGVIIAIRVAFFLGGLLILGAIAWVIYELVFAQN